MKTTQNPKPRNENYNLNNTKESRLCGWCSKEVYVERRTRKANTSNLIKEKKKKPNSLNKIN